MLGARAQTHESAQKVDSKVWPWVKVCARAEAVSRYKGGLGRRTKVPTDIFKQLNFKLGRNSPL